MRVWHMCLELMSFKVSIDKGHISVVQSYVVWAGSGRSQSYVPLLLTQGGGQPRRQKPERSIGISRGGIMHEVEGLGSVEMEHKRRPSYSTIYIARARSLREPHHPESRCSERLP